MLLVALYGRETWPFILRAIKQTEQGAQEDIWTSEASNNRRLERYLINCTP
jgi:hypothetical protein